MPSIILYSTPDCHYCQLARNFFREKNILFTEKDVSENNDTWAEMIERSGQMGVPVIVIRDRVFLGFDQKQIEQFLAEKTPAQTSNEADIRKSTQRPED